MLKIYQNIKNTSFVLLFLGINLTLLYCNCTLQGSDIPVTKKDGRIIVLVEDFDNPESFNKFSNYIKQSASRSRPSKELICIHIESVRCEEDFRRESNNMRNRSENLKRYILEEINKQGWNKQQDEFVLLGFHEGGITVLESAEELKRQINLTKVIIIGAPINGYDFHNADYGLNNGAIGQLITDMSQATLGRSSTVLEELTPNSNYLKQRHDFIESQRGEKDLKFYIAASSLYNLCCNDSSRSNQERLEKADQEVKELFAKSANSIRHKYRKTSTSRNEDDLPGVKDYLRLHKFLKNTDRQGFYMYYKHLNGGKDHNGCLSVETQLAEQLTNPRIRRHTFDSYSGTLFIPYKELERLKPLTLFDKSTEEFILNNINLYRELSEFILDTRTDTGKCCLS